MDNYNNWLNLNDENNLEIINNDKLLQQIKLSDSLCNQSITSIQIETKKIILEEYLNKNNDNIINVLHYILNVLSKTNIDINDIQIIKNILINLTNKNYNKQNKSRNSYIFCENFPLCYNYYKFLIKQKYKNYNICKKDHLCFNKIYFDVINLLEFFKNN